MPRFLHLADIHLGFDHYDNRDRTKDFYLALRDVVQKYAVEAQVDFVIIVGDLFEHRTIQPAILNQAKDCLLLLKEAGIPAIAIEGNHDNRPFGTVTNWLKYLADDELLILLEPEAIDGQIVYEPWDPESLMGGYIDLPCGVRILGSQWYGSAAPKMIPLLAEAIQSLPPHSGNTIMLLHHGLEGQIARYQGALRYNDLLPLQQAGVQYLALGHIHKSYCEEGWVFNPGSLEANNIEEVNYQRGAFLVTLADGNIQAELKTDYYQRSIVRLKLKTTGQETPEDLETKAMQTLQTAIQAKKLDPHQQPIVELRIEGTVGFDRLDLDIRPLQKQLQDASQALIFLLRYNVDSTTYETPLAEDANRMQVEQEVFMDLLSAHNHYKNRASELAHGLIELKDLQLQDRSEPELYEYIQNLLTQET
ncbi:exonuclease SbcCD subunit D [Alkalinema sp. FACHB-956]|uniref:metallophosphoesterase family protein n=1 Tax=Alkalinema sp. FACHB-956 TaxID=2692768 RepID=UPI001682DBD4|nr:exonuclease SbcCD subunit D [Alkalinema sp. FACHB-956]MBD2330142.1 exonuclease SbcCD subunit D [Alkalinema sp. FACHB-956]